MVATTVLPAAYATEICRISRVNPRTSLWHQRKCCCPSMRSLEDESHLDGVQRPETASAIGITTIRSEVVASTTRFLSVPQSSARPCAGRESWHQCSMRALDRSYGNWMEATIASRAAFKAGASVGHAVTTLAKSGSCKTCVPICVHAFVSRSCFNSSS
jgi:hypothetical protein